MRSRHHFGPLVVLALSSYGCRSSGLEAPADERAQAPSAVAASAPSPNDVWISVDSEMALRGSVVSPGRYRVEVDEASQELRLDDGRGVIVLPAEKRSSKRRVAELEAQLRPVAGQPRQLLIVRTPPATEWVVSLTVKGP
jgi:hypothetical protein